MKYHHETENSLKGNNSHNMKKNACNENNCMHSFFTGELINHHTWLMFGSAVMYFHIESGS